MSEDALYQRAGVIPDDIKIIAIDEETFSRLGPYSEWDRGYFAELIEILNENEEAAPKVIGMDIIFSGSNGTEGDKRLVEAAKKYDNLVVASTINLDSYLYKENGKYDHLQYVSGEGKPYDELAEVTDYGFTNAIFDNDGVVRSFYTCIPAHNSGDKEYNSFAYSIAKKLGASKDYEPIVEIAFTSEPGEIETISMVDVLDGKRKPEYFKDCVVLVGAYEEGMRDSFKVPINYSKEKKTELCFSKSDKQQLYLAAMLHDVGKMDVPLEVMDKPTKLGNKEKELCDRLKIISLNIENDALRGYISQEEAQKQLDKINAFINSLGAFNCGKPLNEDEWHLTIMNF